jgi:ABC-type nitrate/sulfonate/bicarbonate transport system permease component
LFAPLAIGVAAFVVFVYGTLNAGLNWAPPYIMRAVLLACASIAFIFTAAYVAPKRKRLIAAVFALVPVALAFSHISVSLLRTGPLATAGYLTGAVIGLFIALNFRPESDALYEDRERSPVPPSFPNIGTRW